MPALEREPAEAGRSQAAVGYELIAVRYATLRTRKSELFYRYETYGEPDAEVDMDYFFWILRRNSECILVDTGFDPEAGARRGRTCLCPPLEALDRLGVTPDCVSTVVVTHLHYDHIGNLRAFPDAKLIVPSKELEFWTGELAGRPQFAGSVERDEIAHVVAALEAGRVRLTDGSEEILDGITAINVGGHSPGQQVTVVAGSIGDVVLASDAVHFYEELDLDRPFSVIADLAEMYRAYDFLRELAASGGVLVPGHDPKVMQGFPAFGEAGDGLAVRVA
jgi:glyoxylase-like metal-dependent hydrolase (beta-lactamase superfamily II)